MDRVDANQTQFIVSATIKLFRAMGEVGEKMAAEGFWLMFNFVALLQLLYGSSLYKELKCQNFFICQHQIKGEFDQFPLS
ncbi:MAG: hypothetical protein RMX99_029245 [Aulosira sp. DedVER01a]|nr:hypothetical protein [Aulosira sp. DedVER01a]